MKQLFMFLNPLALNFLVALGPILVTHHAFERFSSHVSRKIVPDDDIVHLLVPRFDTLIDPLFDGFRGG